jgi:hypothetical protein
MCARNGPQPCSGSGSRAPDRSNVTADGEGGRHEARSRAQGADRRSMILAQPGSGHRAAACAGRRTGGGARSTPLVGPTPPPGVRDRGPGLSPLRRPAAGPRRGDRASRGAAPARRARAGGPTAAAPFRHRLVTRRRSRRPPPAATVALIADTCGARATASTSEEKQSVRTAVRRGRSGRRPWSARPGRPSMPQGGGAAGHRKAPADQPACPPPGCPGGLRRTTCTRQPT